MILLQSSQFCMSTLLSHTSECGILAVDTRTVKNYHKRSLLFIASQHLISVCKFWIKKIQSSFVFRLIMFDILHAGLTSGRCSLKQHVEKWVFLGTSCCQNLLAYLDNYWRVMQEISLWWHVDNQRTKQYCSRSAVSFLRRSYIGANYCICISRFSQVNKTTFM
jgi:hypothetical protein